MTADSTSTALLRAYYAATALFLVLDYFFDFNIRLAFLEPWPFWRFLYYVACFGLLAVSYWRPALTNLVATIESLITLSALILSMGARAVSMSVVVLETGRGIITMEEVINFIIAGGVAWFGWHRGSRALHRDLNR